MTAILKKATADILTRPVISLLILITVGSSAMLLTLALATLMNLSAPYERVFSDLDGAHVWLYLERDLVGQHDIDRIESLPEVVNSTGLRYYVNTRADLRGNQVPVGLRVLPEETPDVNRILLREGHQPTHGHLEALASTDLDDLYKLSVGETLGVVDAAGDLVDVPVVGLAYNPTWDTYRSDQPPYVYVDEPTLSELYPDRSTWGWAVGLRLADPQSIDAFVDRVETVLHDEVVQSHTDWRDVKRAAVFGARLNAVFLGAFGLFAIIATILVVGSSVGSIVLSQFRQIGILKALGFTAGQILSLYLVEYTGLSLVGSLIGMAGGIVVAPLPLRSVAVSLNTTFRPPLNASLILLVLTIVPGIVLAATVGAAYRGARANIVKSIAVGAEAPREQATFGYKVASHLGLPAVLGLGLNDLAAKPFRSLMTGFNLTLGVIGIVFGLTLNQTLETYRTRPELLGLVHDGMVTRRMISDGKTQHLLNQAPTVQAYYREALIEVETPQEQSFKVRAVEGDLTAFPFQIEKGRFFEPNTYEAVAGRGLLDWLDLDVGDELVIEFEDRPGRRVTWEIVGQYPEPTDQGKLMMVSLSTASRWTSSAEPDTYFLRLSDECPVSQLTAYLKQNSGDDLNLTLAEQAIPDDVVYLQIAIFALGAILIGIALVNVFNTSLLAMQEKTRDIGIFKTVGMTPAQVMTMVNTSAACLGLVAAVVGVPAGYALTKGILASLSETYGFGRVHVDLSPLRVALLVPLAVLASIAGSILPGRRAARLSIVSVLRQG